MLYFRLYKQLKSEVNPRYIPHTLYFKYIDKKFNFDNRAVFDDKSYYKLLFPDAMQPMTIINCVKGTFLTPNYEAISKKEAYDIVRAYNKEHPVIFKKSIDSSGGKGITLLPRNASNKEIEDAFKMSDNFIVQQVIKEHTSLSSLHPESINTIRVMTIVLNGKVHILSTICRIGVGDSAVDNVSSGGLCIGVDELGHLRDLAYSRKENKFYDKHPLGYAFKDKALPLDSLKQVQELCKTLALRVPFCKLVSWDFVLSEDGSPLLIESNMTRGVLSYIKCVMDLFLKI